MVILSINYDEFRACPDILFEEMRRRGVDGCISYKGLNIIVKLEVAEAANDSQYRQEQD